MMSIHLEVKFEDEICDYLSRSGWIYEKDAANKYNKDLALFPSDLIEWLKESQIEAWQTLEKKHKSRTEDVLIQRTRAVLNTSGTLDVLRQGVDIFGLKEALKLAQFKPGPPDNKESLKRYKANRLRVIRQVKYSLHNENCIDLVLFLNGIPVATVELKTDNTQNIEKAIEQYKKDRKPNSSGKKAEPLLTFSSGALVHFAVSNKEVRMTTKLDGDKTFFLPFNKGSNPGNKDCGAGNPSTDGHQTDYLWKEIWERENWLEIIARYFSVEKNKKNKIQKILFPRYHQWRVTRKLQEAVVKEGPGKKYLIQHSAGSGKTNSIAWTAHFFSELHNDQIKKVFDSVLVVSDRNVIDTQLQEALESFQRKKGVVASIKRKDGSKSDKLAKALSGEKKIVVCTIQTFPYALEEVQKLSATESKTFAVIADEAHSSQTGEAAAKLKQVLSPSEIKELNDGGEASIDDLLAAQMTNRASDNGITYVAFTATPKAKTLELFGTRPKPNEPAWDGNLPEPFDVYSMRQAIEEGFILDVLRNYTNYDVAFQLAQKGSNLSQEEVDRGTAQRKLMSWVKLHPHNIAQKVEVIVEHFNQFIRPLLNQKAKAMVVVSSRREAVRWKLAIDNYINKKKYPLGTLVAFSGEVKDKVSGPDPFTEKSKKLNPGLRGDIREVFKGDNKHILIVANKFQTGFDQPLLCGMYLDRKLSGVQAVQTLSRLNRCHPNKVDTYVVDFANDSKDILDAFKTYYSTAELTSSTKPELILELKTKLDSQNYYDESEINEVVKILLDPKGKQSQLQGSLGPVASRVIKEYTEARLALKQAEELDNKKEIETAQDSINSLFLFRKDMTTYVRFYTFLSQIHDYANTGYEKRAIFYKRLLPLLEFELDRPEPDLSKIVLTQYQLKNRGETNYSLNPGDHAPIGPLNPGSGGVRDEDKVQMEEIIQMLNKLFTGDLTEKDKFVYVGTVIKEKLLESKTLQEQAKNSNKKELRDSPDLLTNSMDAYMDSLDAHRSMSTQVLNDPYCQQAILDLLIDKWDLWEELKKRADES